MDEFIRLTIHYGLHFILPGCIAWLFYRERWRKVWLVMLLTMLMDIDHLFSNPIFDPNRCSINYHYFHTYYVAIIYCILLIFKRTRIIGIGTMLHLFADLEDCLWL
jgi:hypothetical protein